MWITRRLYVSQCTAKGKLSALILHVGSGRKAHQLNNTIQCHSLWVTLEIHDRRQIKNTDNTETRHNPEKKEQCKTKQNKTTWFSCLLQHSRARKKVGLFYNAPTPPPRSPEENTVTSFKSLDPWQIMLVDQTCCDDVVTGTADENWLTTDADDWRHQMYQQ